MAEGKFVLAIYRGSKENQYWEEFEFDRKDGLNIISVLMEIQRNPMNKEGKRVSPVVWEQACLEEVCGSCSMLINGIPRQACTALIEDIIKSSKSTRITLSPMTKFPLVRDLVVDRSNMFEHLKQIQGWVPIQTLHSEEFGPRIKPKVQEAAYVASTCMTCGVCLEACPQFNSRSKFVGAHTINQVKKHNLNPTSKALKRDRLKEMMKGGGISDCGNAQNCVAYCPKKIPLTEAIAAVGKDASAQSFKEFFGLPENDKD